ncbi:MAG TPA: hypothetical protein PKW36_12550 [bacterium]|nr:hypothetical protein [bacterium]
MKTWIILLSFTAIANAQNSELYFQSDSERALFKDSIFFKTNNSTEVFENLLITEGVSDSSSIRKYRGYLEKIAARLSKEINLKSKASKKAEVIFTYLHKNIFKKYNIDTRFQDLFSRGEYNCVTATYLYYDMCKRFDLNVTFYASAVHIYPVVKGEQRPINVELTDPVNGFDFREDRKAIINYLLEYKLITQDELKSKGSDAVYREYVDKTKEVGIPALYSISYSNQGISYWQAGKLKETLWAMEKALSIIWDDSKSRAIYQSVFDENLNKILYDVPSAYPVVIRGLQFMRSDTSFVRDHFNFIMHAIEYYSVTKLEYDKALEIVNEGKAIFSFDTSLVKRLTEFSRDVRWNQFAYVYNASNYEKAAAILEIGLSEFPNDARFLDFQKKTDLLLAERLSDKGDYQGAINRLSGLRKKYSSDFRIEDTYVGTVTYFASKCAQNGESKKAIDLMDSLASSLPENFKVKESYSAIVGLIISTEELDKKNIYEARRLIIKAIQVDTKNITMTKMLAAIYHELAMAKVRKKEYLAAKNLILEGLGYIPQSYELNDDLKLIKQQLGK